jgi:hypothetical protein
VLSVSADKIFLFPVLRGKRFFYSPKRPDRLCGPPSHLFNRYRGSFLGFQRLGDEADHSPASSTEFKMWRYTPTPLTFLYGVDTNTFFIQLYLRLKYGSMFSHETLSAKLHGVTSQTIAILHSGFLVSRPRCESPAF